MVEIQNRDAVKRLEQDTLAQPSISLPKNIVNSVQPVIIANPERFVTVMRNVSNGATGTLTAYTTPSTKKNFYLTSIAAGIQEDSTSDNIATIIQITVNGVIQQPYSFRKLATTTTSKDIFLNYNPPIKIDKNSALTITNAFTAGAATKFLSITGYEVEEM